MQQGYLLIVLVAVVTGATAQEHIHGKFELTSGVTEEYLDVLRAMEMCEKTMTNWGKTKHMILYMRKDGDSLKICEEKDGKGYPSTTIVGKENKKTSKDVCEKNRDVYFEYDPEDKNTLLRKVDYFEQGLVMAQIWKFTADGYTLTTTAVGAKGGDKTATLTYKRVEDDGKYKD